MNKTLLATVILSSFVSGAVSAATVYDKDDTKLSVGGRAEVRGLFSDSVEGTMKDKSRARINFSGETKIAEGLTGFAFVEYEMTPEATDKDDKDDGYYLKNRYLFAGIGTQAGDFSYGKQDTANVQISDMTDIASTHSGQQQFIDAAADKQSNTFFYANTFLDNNLSVQANFIASETEDKDALGVSALYSTDFGLELGVAYADQDKENQVTLGAGYTFNDLYLAATYAMGEVAENDDFTSLEVAAQYKVTKEFRMIAMYGIAEEDVKGDTADFAALEGQYRFNKNLRTYASYKLNNLDDKDDELVAGLRYNF
jgi:outer membrane porin protein LC